MNHNITSDAASVETNPKIQLAGEGQKLNVLGDNQTIKLSGKDTGGLFTIVENYNDPGVGIPMHVHDNEDEIFFILEGEMEFETQGETSILKAGDMIFLPRRIPHAFRVVGTQKARASVTIIPSGIEEMFEALSELPPGQPDLEKVSDICQSYGISFV
ncbi:cupin domain-containing protein [Flavobacterium sp.]|uniref:cupin domain-containing protein n=1 Tax=Flavobacterium sp. TaxID=239 RepID=UPI0039E35A42